MHKERLRDFCWQVGMSEARWFSYSVHFHMTMQISRNVTLAVVFHLGKMLWSCDLGESGSPSGLSCFLEELFCICPRPFSETQRFTVQLGYI